MAIQLTDVVLNVNGKYLANNGPVGVSKDVLATTSVGDRLTLAIDSVNGTYVLAEKHFQQEPAGVGVITLNLVSALSF